MISTLDCRQYWGVNCKGSISWLIYCRTCVLRKLSDGDDNDSDEEEVKRPKSVNASISTFANAYGTFYIPNFQLVLDSNT